MKNIPINKHIFIEKGLKNTLLSQKQYIFLNASQLLNMEIGLCIFHLISIMKKKFYFPRKSK